jgi:hypothetical protein
VEIYSSFLGLVRQATIKTINNITKKSENVLFIPLFGIVRETEGVMVQLAIFPVILLVRAGGFDVVDSIIWIE